jgi:hypothetical protein
MMSTMKIFLAAVATSNVSAITVRDDNNISQADAKAKLGAQLKFNLPKPAASQKPATGGLESMLAGKLAKVAGSGAASPTVPKASSTTKANMEYVSDDMNRRVREIREKYKDDKEELKKQEKDFKEKMEYREEQRDSAQRQLNAANLWVVKIDFDTQERTYVNRLTGEEQKENPVQQLYNLSSTDMMKNKAGAQMTKLLAENEQDPRMANPFEIRSSLLAGGEKKVVQKKKSLGQQNSGLDLAALNDRLTKQKSKRPSFTLDANGNIVKPSEENSEASELRKTHGSIRLDENGNIIKPVETQEKPKKTLRNLPKRAIHKVNKRANEGIKKMAEKGMSEFERKMAERRARITN